MGTSGDKRGMGITELVVVAGIASVVAVGFSGMLVNSIKGQQGVQVKSSLQQFKSLLTLTLANSDSCNKALGNELVDGSPVRVKRVDDPTQVWFQDGTNMVPDGFTMTSVNLAPHASNPNLALLRMSVRATNPQGVMGPANFPLIIIPLYVKLAGNRVQECGTAGPGGGTNSYNCALQGGSMIDLGNTGVAQCFLPNQISGMVVWIRDLTAFNPIAEGTVRNCQPSDNVLDVVAKSAAYCINPNSALATPCCRRGFKRVRTGEHFYLPPDPSPSSQHTFTCTFVGPQFCWKPGENGCDCN